MKPEDKYGNEICQEVYQKMRHFGRMLLSHGYKESKIKPNLFYRLRSKDFLYFADLRGTHKVRIYDDPTPLLYATFPDIKPKLEIKRLLEEEQARLGFGRFSYLDENEPE